jgi:uncharacterized protein (TIGR03435 family)
MWCWAATGSTGCELIWRYDDFVVRFAGLIALLGVSVLAQAPLRPSFEAATVKLNPNCGERRGRGGGIYAGGFNASCITMRTLIQTAYGLPGYGRWNPRQIEVSGGPAWLDSEVYDVAAKGEVGASVEHGKEMLRTLLEDRCKLMHHRVSKEIPVYALTVAKGGPKMKAPIAGSCRPNAIDNFLAGPAPDAQVAPLCGWTSTMRNGALTVKTGLGVTMEQFAIGMLATLDRAVANRTGLAGIFDIHLSYASDDGVSRDWMLDGPSIFSAVQNQLGLKLSPDKGSVELLAIDSVERPSEN